MGKVGISTAYLASELVVATPRRGPNMPLHSILQQACYRTDIDQVIESYKGNAVNGVSRTQIDDGTYIRVKSNGSTVLKSNASNFSSHGLTTKQCPFVMRGNKYGVYVKDFYARGSRENRDEVEGTDEACKVRQGPDVEIVSDHCEKMRRKNETNLNGDPTSKHAHAPMTART
ncbi:hypothetical protein B0H10DRAFT_1949144 [Mycena sp. CBHHK59/15]|nr:hypothetical protein B0H10DRAFT_1949144 [Mycena sp. CBHHK59/15]